MEMFCDRINSAVESGEKVRVFGDRDVDGITSTVLMVQELKSLGLDVTYTIPTGDETYGFSKRLFRQRQRLCREVHPGKAAGGEVRRHRLRGELSQLPAAGTGPGRIPLSLLVPGSARLA